MCVCVCVCVCVGRDEPQAHVTQKLTVPLLSPDYSGVEDGGGLSGKPVPLRPLPVPTLYNGTTPETKGQLPKFSPLELLVYNIAAMLASVAAGYDVRLSNVTAVHPRLLPVK